MRTLVNDSTVSVTQNETNFSRDDLTTQVASTVDLREAKLVSEKEQNDISAIERASPTPSSRHLSGWRFHVVLAGLLLGVFISTMEATIVSTALVDITNTLQAFSNSSWVINAYLLTFTGFLIIWAQFSHTIGRKPSVILAYILFIAFSGGCAGAKSSTQLIVLRALQGIGGAGVFNMSMVLLPEITRPEEFPKYAALVSAMYAASYGLGPLIGGAISSRTTWRWVFWINIPLSVVPLALIIIALPARFPNHNREPTQKNLWLSLARLDVLGAALFLCTSVLFVTALQGADIEWDWNSATNISLLVIAGATIILFTAWERFVTLRRTYIVPILTWRFSKRKPVAMFINFCLVSTPLISTLVQLPERFQVINQLSPFNAAVRLLPFILVVPVVSFIAAIGVKMFKLRHAYALLVGTAFQIAGAVCFAVDVPYDQGSIPARVYGFETLMAIGLGINNTLLVTVVPYIVERPLIPTAMGAGMQFRYLGGALGLGILTAVLNSYLRHALPAFLTPSQVSDVLRSSETLAALSSDLQVQAREAFAAGFSLQWKVLLGFIAAQVPASLAML